MVFITRSELNKMAKKVVDKTTGMTELDRFENQHCYEDWSIIEDDDDSLIITEFEEYSKNML